MSAREKLLALAARLQGGSPRLGADLDAAARALRELVDHHIVLEADGRCSCRKGNRLSTKPCPVLDAAAKGLPE